MVVLVNSAFHNTGASVLTYMLTKMYGNKMNQPSLFMNLGSMGFYKSAIQVEETWDSQAVSMVLNKLHGRNSFRPFCYKLEETVYYYNASQSNLKTQVGVKDLELLIAKASKDFGMVFVDIDIESNGFVKLVQIADKVLYIVPPDIASLNHTRETMLKTHASYEASYGLAIKPDIIYVVSKYDDSISLPAVYKILDARATDCSEVRLCKELARARNKRQLDYFIADILIKPANSDLRRLNLNLTKLLGKLNDHGR